MMPSNVFAAPDAFVHKSEKQPFCRFCGNPIGRSTITEMFWTPSRGGKDSSKTARSKEELQARTNLQVIKVRMSKDYEGNLWVSFAEFWDGESYQDEFFCSKLCTNRFGIAAAKSGYMTERYREAIKRPKLQCF